MNVLLAAGGTGGHLFPAASLASALKARGVEVDLATDDRALKYGGDFAARAIHPIPSATPTRAGLVAKAQATAMLGVGVLAALRLLMRLKPAAVIGFGGYPTVPPLVAASLLGVPTILHEQNAVLGRANRFLSRRVTCIAAGFPDPGGVAADLKAKLRLTGNPVRPAVLAAAETPYPDFADGKLRVLVTGGSQGARVMSEVVPAALALLGGEERARLDLALQARGEDRARASADCAKLGFPAEIAEFFADLPARIAAAHLVVARAGASTVSELAVIGRPAVLVPYPHALDQDQAANAALLAKAGAATVIRQSEFTPEALASIWWAALADPAALQARAAAARAAGVPDAAERLAALVTEIAGAKR
jgi:UDP-N-acetylglucosamine--N-acetylmuramyl-(pentapeptide) pyrophosphoryl-undecaprenol N-acetylglucosamine transferase